jgi:hypothetical protein
MGIEYRLPSETWPSPPDGALTDGELVDLWVAEKPHREEADPNGDLSTCENCYAGYDPDDEGDAGACGQCAWDEDDEEPADV